MNTTAIFILVVIGLFGLGIWSHWLKWKKQQAKSEKSTHDDVVLPTMIGDPWPVYREELLEAFLLLAKTYPDDPLMFLPLIEITRKLSVERPTSPYKFEEARRVDELHANALRRLKLLKDLLQEPKEEQSSLCCRGEKQDCQ